MTQDTEEIKVICAWCEKHMGIKEVILNPDFQGVPSHGICESCLDKMINKEDQ